MKIDFTDAELLLIVTTMNAIINTEYKDDPMGCFGFARFYAKDVREKIGAVLNALEAKNAR